MKVRKFVDVSDVGFRKMELDGNIDKGFWHHQSLIQRIEAAINMIMVAYQEPDFTHKRVDRTAFSFRKRST
jgi:hypothetical protein